MIRHRLIVLAAFTFATAAALGQPRTLIGGHFENKADFDISVNVSLYPLDYIEGNTTTLVATLDKKNDFRTYVSVDKPLHVQYLNHDSPIKDIYAYPGDSLWLSVTANDAIVRGSNKTLLAFLNEFNARFRSPELKSRDDNGFKNPDRVAFAKYQKEQLNRQLRFVMEYFIGLPPMQQEMKRLIEADLKYDFALKMLRYSRSHGNEGRFVFRYADYMQQLEEIPANDPQAMLSMKYVEYLRELPYSLWYAEINWSQKHKEPYKSTLEGQYLIRDSIARKYFTGEVYELALYAILYDAVAGVEKAKGSPAFDGTYTYTDKLIADLGRNFTNGIYYTRIKEHLEAVKEKN